ncbi:STAS domain-containing protein [Streptomyces sp. NPDC101132]|uniref:STAS domain-containing protein n=1 Tax=Streptomyces sp. NPDC101132 TaxID=3366110 RepID=UPI0038025456
MHGRVHTLDLSAVGFMDSSGLHMLPALRRRARAEGGALELAGVPCQALRLPDLTGPAPGPCSPTPTAAAIPDALPRRCQAAVKWTWMLFPPPGTGRTSTSSARWLTSGQP